MRTSSESTIPVRDRLPESSIAAESIVHFQDEVFGDDRTDDVPALYAASAAFHRTLRPAERHVLERNEVRRHPRGQKLSRVGRPTAARPREQSPQFRLKGLHVVLRVGRPVEAFLRRQEIRPGSHLAERVLDRVEADRRVGGVVGGVVVGGDARVDAGVRGATVTDTKSAVSVDAMTAVSLRVERSAVFEPNDSVDASAVVAVVVVVGVFLLRQRAMDDDRRTGDQRGVRPDRQRYLLQLFQLDEIRAFRSDDLRLRSASDGVTLSRRRLARAFRVRLVRLLPARHVVDDDHLFRR